MRKLKKLKLHKYRFQFRLNNLKKCSDKVIYNEVPRVIISLTSYSARFSNLDICLETLLNQTYKVHKVILWVSNTDKQKLPKRVLKLEKLGLEIRGYEDILSYKKLIPSLKEFKEDIIVTTDDDQVYPPNLIESLVSAYINDREVIHCTAARMITFNENGVLNNYTYWPNVPKSIEEKSFSIMPIGYGGVLYPPGCFTKEVMNKEVFMDICKYGDDIWFKAMSLLNGVKCHKIINKYKLYELTYEQDPPLSVENKFKGRNDKQIKSVFKKYNIAEKFN